MTTKCTQLSVNTVVAILLVHHTALVDLGSHSAVTLFFRHAAAPPLQYVSITDTCDFIHNKNRVWIKLPVIQHLSGCHVLFLSFSTMRYLKIYSGIIIIVMSRNLHLICEVNREPSHLIISSTWYPPDSSSRSHLWRNCLRGRSLDLGIIVIVLSRNSYLMCEVRKETPKAQVFYPISTWLMNSPKHDVPFT